MFHSRFSFLFIFALVVHFGVPKADIVAQSIEIGPLSFGNSKNNDGIRFNFRDKDVETINGVNITIWKSYGNNTSLIRGLAIGLPYANAGTLKGVGFSLLATVADQEAKGILVGGLATVVGENANASMFSGLTNVVGGNGKGLMLTGLMNINGEDYKGMQLAGLGNITGENYKGIQLGGLMNIVGENMHGAQFSALMNINGESAQGVRAASLMNITGESSRGFDAAILMNVTGENAKGFAAAGIMNVSGHEMRGFSVAGLMNVSEHIKGISIAAANVGVNLSGTHVGVVNLTNPKMGDLSGFALAPVNIARHNQSGFTIGIFNFAKKLNSKGLQIGLFNVVKSNPRGLKLLPFFNKNFR